MLALMETGEGYTYADYMFYVKDEGKGATCIQVIGSEDMLEEILDQYDEQKVINITVIKATEPNLGDLNRGNFVEEQVPTGQVGQSNIIDEDGVLFPFVQSNSEELY